MSPNEVNLTEEQQKVVAQAERFAGELSTFKISTRQEYDKAGEFRVSIKTRYKEIENLRFSFTRPLDDLKKRWTAIFQTPLDKLMSADKALERGRLDYQREQERIRQIEQERLRKQAEAEEARQRKIKEEQERAWREKEEAARKEAERLAAEGKAKEAAKAQAEAEKAARIAAERRIQAESVQVVVPIIASTVTQTAGISGRKNWKFEITDENAIPRKYLVPDMVKIGKQVRACGDTIAIPGIRIYVEEGEAVRR